MYPRVKVRELEDVNRLSPPDDRPLLFLKILQSAASQNRSSNEENKSNYPSKIPRITKTSKDISNKKELKSNSRVTSSVLRPRAVLSSPDNDGLIRNRNKFDSERAFPLKKLNNSEQKISDDTTAIRSPVIKAKTDPVRARKTSKESFDNKGSGFKQNESLKALLQRQKEGNSSSIGI